MLELLRGHGTLAGEAVQSAPVVAYSVSYPLGVVIPILAIALVPRFLRGEVPNDARTSHSWPAASRERAGSGGLIVGTMQVTRDDAIGISLEALMREAGGRVQPGRVRRVVLDPGHGGSDPGAIGPTGLREKDVVLAVALMLRERLNAVPGMRVMLTRDGDYFVPLQERVRKARRVQADLFVSLSTVKSHVASLMTKLGARNRVEIAMWAYDTRRV